MAGMSMSLLTITPAGQSRQYRCMSEFAVGDAARRQCEQPRGNTLVFEGARTLALPQASIVEVTGDATCS